VFSRRTGKERSAHSEMNHKEEKKVRFGGWTKRPYRWCRANFKNRWKKEYAVEFGVLKPRRDGGETSPPCRKFF